MHGRHQTAQIVTTEDQMFLLDCGESTQMQMQNYKIRKSRINHIFISHLHGDHYYGLFGLLNSYSLNNRKNPLHLYATPALKQVIDLQLQVSDSSYGFELIFHPITNQSVLLDLPNLSVTCFPVSHRIACWGFLFREKESQRKKEGNGPKSYAYCADTRYNEDIIPHIINADLIYHESTYLQDESERAFKRFHSTSSQAATIALKAGAKKLLLGHFSSKYGDLTDFENEARAVFQNTEISQEGVTYLIR